MSESTPDLKIERGFFRVYFIHDVADTIDLSALKNAERGFEQKPLNLKAPASPNYIQFAIPPLVATLPDLTIAHHTAIVRLKLYDYGTVSLRFSFPFSGSWEDFSELSRSMKQSTELYEKATELLQDTLKRINHALMQPHIPLLEDYFVFQVEEFSSPITATSLLGDCRAELASLMMWEEKHLTISEQDEVLRVHFSYFETDLVVVQWDDAFVYEVGECAQAVEDILEFANTQLVEFRTYDARLDAELDEIYKWNMVRKRPTVLGRRAALQRIDQLRNLIIDVRDLSDRSSNALKVIGEAFYARLYRAIAARLGLADWEQQIESKLNSVAEIYRFATDQAQYTRSEFLEIVIIALITIEIALSLFGHH